MPVPGVADERLTDAPKQEYGPGIPGYEPAPQDHEPDKITFIELHRGVCLGARPEQDMTLDSDGTAACTGGRFPPTGVLWRRARYSCDAATALESERSGRGSATMSSSRCRPFNVALHPKMSAAQRRRSRAIRGHLSAI
jgi:hypothetical protein